MKKLTMESTIKNGKKSDMKVSDLVNIKGKIFSLIKEGYYFDDEVLKAAHITKTIREKKAYSCVRDITPTDHTKLPKETASMKQILFDINTITKTRESGGDEEFSSYNNQIDSTSFDDIYKDND